MSIETLPTYPNLFDLPTEHIIKIEEACRKARHLALNKNLLDEIKGNLYILETLGLSQSDIYTNHRNMKLKFDHVDEFGAYTISDEKHGDHAYDLLTKVPAGFSNGWCLRNKTTNEVMLNAQHLRVTCYVWGGAEQCPIEQSFTKEYFGYERGDRDWFVTNLDLKLQIWIPDLLPAQVAMFGFAQSLSSPYRLDLELYAKLMGLTGLVEPIKSHKVACWSRPDGPHELQRAKLTILEEVRNNVDGGSYHAILCVKNGLDGSKTKNMMIHFDVNREWVETHEGAKIKVFGLDFDIGGTFNLENYLVSKEVNQIILDERDDSDAINKKIKAEYQPKCIIQ
jgi:hypothetical protein